MQTNILYIILALFLVGFGVLIYFIISLKKQSEKPVDDQSLKIMMEWMKEIKQGTDSTREGVQKSINDTNKAINERLDNAGRVIAQLTKELGGISQVGPDIRRLTETLASPKLRGNFGEEMLENMLSQALPNSGFEIQHKFKNGEVVDAIIYVGEKILPIDSKFSMENFRLYKEATTEEAAEALKKTFLKDVKKRVDEIHKKYILPQENTFDFALMYIPSEGVFSEVLDDSTTLTYGREKKVYFVSPNTLYHHLQIILLSCVDKKLTKPLSKFWP
ncbi:MAG: DNA recombination protein RmuC [Candidatus Doudnabacteria bacterium]|jgi:DNA recombination protein RmuC